MLVRRLFSMRIRAQTGAIWPVMPGSERQPKDWPGWPDGKKFALVFTHDVEGQVGLNRCRQLMALEMEAGFRSSFNFVPEGDYTTPSALREELVGNGFEVGVHDLRHDGLLYRSRSRFDRNAERINHYLKEWNAVGFRSGFMLNQLEWIHGLDIQYDASTFDTDPFEPQPHGQHTVFPFWVPAHGKEASERKDALKDSVRVPLAASNHRRPGYVELPYTLPQDSTLFLLLGEKTPEIWIRKLDWIAEHGGMALLNIHPDYIDFCSGGFASDSYPAALIRQFMAYVSKKYSGMYWNPCAKELAAWYKKSAIEQLSKVREESRMSSASSLPEPSQGILAGKRVAVLLYSYYLTDPRPRRAAEALAKSGMEVDVLCLRQSNTEAERETVDGVNIFRTRMQRVRGTALNYIWRYGRFILSSFWFVLSRGWRRKYDLVHVHNMPDALVFASLAAKLRGARIILDLHDPMPELMMGIYGVEAGHPAVSLLRLLERWSIRFADLALTPNITFRNLFISRSCPPEKMQIVMNSPRQDVFNPDRLGPDSAPGPAKGEFRIMHHGELVERHGIDLLVGAVARVRPEIPGVHLDIYGRETPFVATILEIARQVGIADIVHYHGPKSQVEIALAIRNSDLGVIPNRRSAFTEINLPTRIFEFLSMHRPVIVPNTRGIRDYFGSDEILRFEPGDVDDLATRILWVRAHPNEVLAFVARGVEVYRKHLWNGEEARFLDQVSSLLK